MASKGRWIEDLVRNYRGDINELETEIVDTFRPKIEVLKDKMIDELKEELEEKGFKIYVQWIQKYDSFWSLTDFNLNEFFLAKFENNWYTIEIKKNSIYINSKEFRKFATIDMSKVSSYISPNTLSSIGYTYDKKTDQLKLVDKKNCSRRWIYDSHRHRDFSRKFKLDGLLNLGGEKNNEIV
jgi:hypothetical protein